MAAAFLPRVALAIPVCLAATGLALVVWCQSRQAEVARLEQQGAEELSLRGYRMRVKLSTVREYEAGRIDLPTAAQRFAEVDSSDEARLAELRESHGGEPDDLLYAQMVVGYVLSSDSGRPERPQHGDRAKSDFERVYGHLSGSATVSDEGHRSPNPVRHP